MFGRIMNDYMVKKFSNHNVTSVTFIFQYKMRRITYDENITHSHMSHNK